jgi:hypothetical protein
MVDSCHSTCAAGAGLAGAAKAAPAKKEASPNNM